MPFTVLVNSSDIFSIIQRGVYKNSVGSQKTLSIKHPVLSLITNFRFHWHLMNNLWLVALVHNYNQFPVNLGRALGASYVSICLFIHLFDIWQNIGAMIHLMKQWVTWIHIKSFQLGFFKRIQDFFLSPENALKHFRNFQTLAHMVGRLWLNVLKLRHWN